MNILRIQYKESGNPVDQTGVLTDQPRLPVLMSQSTVMSPAEMAGIQLVVTLDANAQVTTEGLALILQAAEAGYTIRVGNVVIQKTEKSK